MASSFLFYDLETSGFDPRAARIMQFAGQRTDMNLKPIGKPINELIKLTPDVLPEPNAVLLHGITPQKSLSEGLTEAEFLKLFYEQIVQPDTIFLGFNSIRFDDEFMRFLHYRNFYDAYEWQWKNGSSRWDLLDVARMTRALRPEGIMWPFAPDGKPTNRLGFLAAVNELAHTKAHDALSDVQVTLALAKLIQSKQPELFRYLAGMRDKKKIKAEVLKGQPFIYTSGRYSSEYLHTSAVVLLSPHPKQDAALVYDLRFNPAEFVDLSVDELVKAWKFSKDSEALRLPVKTLKYNRAPAIAPLGVLDAASQERLDLEVPTIKTHLARLKKHQTDFTKKIFQALDLLDAEREKAQVSLVDNELTVDGRLYDGFWDEQDCQTLIKVRHTEPAGLSGLAESFHDDRLKSLLPLYKARNFPEALADEERTVWEKFCTTKLMDGGTSSRLSSYFGRLEALADTKLNTEQQYLLEELQLYGQSLLPQDY